MSNEYRDDQRRGGVRGEDDAEDIIDACEPICYVRNPIIPHPSRANSWWEKDFLVYTRQEHLFCIEMKTYRGTISYPRRDRTVSPGKGRPPQSSGDSYDYSHIVQEKEGQTLLVKPNPLERTRQYIPHLKAYLRGVNLRLQDLPIIPVAAFSPKGISVRSTMWNTACSIFMNFRRFFGGTPGQHGFPIHPCGWSRHYGEFPRGMRFAS